MKKDPFVELGKKIRKDPILEPFIERPLLALIILGAVLFLSGCAQAPVQAAVEGHWPDCLPHPRLKDGEAVGSNTRLLELTQELSHSRNDCAARYDALRYAVGITESPASP